MTVGGTNSTIFHQSVSLIMIVPVGTGKGILLRQNIRQAHSKATQVEATTKRGKTRVVIRIRKLG